MAFSMPPLRARHHREQVAENLAGAGRIGIGQRGARYRAPADVIEPCRMVLQAANDFPQAGRTRKLAVQQRDELALGRQAANPVVRTVLLGQAIEFAPRNPLQQIGENAIVVPHGVAPFRVQKTRQRQNTSRINTVRSVRKI